MIVVGVYCVGDISCSRVIRGIVVIVKVGYEVCLVSIVI